MKKILSVVSAKYVNKLRLEVSFNDGLIQIIDFADFLQQTKLPDLKKFRKASSFKNFKIINGNVMWGDFEMIFPVEDLYKNKIFNKDNSFGKIA